MIALPFLGVKTPKLIDVHSSSRQDSWYWNPSACRSLQKEATDVGHTFGATSQKWTYQFTQLASPLSAFLCRLIGLLWTPETACHPYSGSIHRRLYAPKYLFRCHEGWQVFGYAAWEPSASASASGLSCFLGLGTGRRCEDSSRSIECCMQVQPAIHSRSHHLTSLYRQCQMHVWLLLPMESLPWQMSLEWLVWILRW